ncbi:MAG: thiamine biosynthesis protein ThiS [Betaproteobacteria bacterium HGW-Betaproteobacteria-9]|jgi:sulfur carrier protein|nr:sulfur carrier protein ThiS [Hydrogenophaga sp.]PKO28826.1 MAG: thiamine biosynthesis protein ThiS [Betaproteobacteria bacterium HGW-Betaproteobacteria-9]
MPETLIPVEATLRFNEHTLPCQDGLTLAALLEAQGVDANQMATAVNGEFVARALREQHPLQPGDTVLTFQAIVGG